MITELKTYSISSTITNFPLADSGGPHAQEEGDRCLDFFFEAGFGGYKRLECNSLSYLLTPSLNEYCDGTLVISVLETDKIFHGFSSPGDNRPHLPAHALVEAHVVVN